MLLVAVWLPTASHALLHNVGIIHQVHAHDEHGDDSHEPHSPGSHEHGASNHDAADGLGLTPAGKVQVPMPTFVVVPDWLAVPLVTPLMDADFAALHSGLSPPGVAPPELSHTWQFSFRASLPPRAPSLIP